MIPLVYVVPLVSPEACRVWESTSALCARTIACLLAGPPEIRVILVCNKAPALPADARLTIIERDFSLPQKWEDGHVDKYKKIKAALIEARPLAPFWLMKVDADDLVSRRLPGFIASLPGNASGVIVKRGYAHRAGSGWLKAVRDFDMICGTSNIIRIGPEDLPGSEQADPNLFLPLKLGHNIAEKYFIKAGNPLIPAPFPAVIYTVGHPDNHSGISLFPGSRRLILRQMWNLRPLTQEIRHEFGIGTP